MKINIEEIYERAKKNSVGNIVKSKLVENKRKIAMSTLTSVIALTSMISLCSCNNDINYIGANNYSSFSITSAQQKLEDNNIEYYDGEKRVSNDVSAYASIDDLCEDDLLGFYKLLGKEESEKVVQALGYEDWDDYLTQNNYVDEDGKASIKNWERDVQVKKYYGDGEKTK